MRMFVAALIAFSTPASADTIVVINAKAWTMIADKPIENATILIRDGKILSVASNGPVALGASVIDAQGRNVTPALFGAATHLGLVAVSAAEDTDDRSVASGPLGASFAVRFAINPNDLAIEEARAAGMSRSVVVPTGSTGAPFDGVAAMIRLSRTGDNLENGSIAMVATINGEATGVGGSRSAAWQILRNALDEALRYRNAANDGKPRDQLLNRLDIEALGPVVAGTMPLMIRVHRESDIRQAIALSRDYRIKIIVAGGSEAWRVARDLAAAAIPVIIDPLADLPMSYDETGARSDNAAILDKAGVKVAFSVSAQGIYLAYSPAQALREGAGIAVANGMNEAAALRAITRNPASIWGMEATAGTIKPGSDADLVIWDGDPIEPSTAPFMVLSKGSVTTLTTRQTRLRDRYRPSGAPTMDVPK